jgi:plastocyanin
MRSTILGTAFALAALAAANLATPAQAYEAITVTDGGSLSGTVKFDGTPPAPKKIEVTKDQEVCGKNGPEIVDPALIVSSGGGIQDVAVVVKATKGKALEVPTEPVTFDQNGCEYKPHVLAFPAGSTISILNSDGILHNVHVMGKENPEANRAQPKFQKKIDWKVEKPEWPIAVKCDAHPWMHAYWLSMDQPYFAVTDADGNFKITDLPPGDYDVEIWQGELGKKTEKVTIKAKEDTKVGWSMGKS